MAKTRAQKEQAVSTLTDKLGQAKSVIFADYKGLSTSQLSQLRGKLKSQGAQLLITKNTLLKRALSTILDDRRLKIDLSSTVKNLTLFEGPTATLFSYEDEVTPITTIVKSLTEYSMGSVKGGFLGQDFLDSFSLIKLAGLPSKQELRAQAVGTLAAPLLDMVGVLQANLRNLVYALDQIRVQRGGGG